MIRIPPVKLLLIVFLQCADVVLLAYNDCSNPCLAGTLVIRIYLLMCNMGK